MLRGIRVRHFSILTDVLLGADLELLRKEAAEGKEPKKIGLSPMVALIGRNETGKSAMLNALAFLRDVLVHDLHFACNNENRGGYSKLLTASNPENNEEMSFELLFDSGRDTWVQYCIGLDEDRHNRPFIEFEELRKITLLEGRQLKEEVLLRVDSGEGFVISPAFGKNEVSLLDRKQCAFSLYGRMLQFREICACYTQIKQWYIASPQSFPGELNKTVQKGGHKHLNERFDNVRNVLNYLEKEDPERYRNMIREITRKIPDYQRIGDSFLDSGISSGNLRLFTLLLLLEDDRPLICLDEPAGGLYHDMVSVMANEMRAYTLDKKGAQILLTTHNYNLLEHFRADEVWVFERRNNQVSARTLGDDPLVQSMIQEGLSLGMLWYGGHLGVN